MTESQLTTHQTVGNTELPLSAGVMRGWHGQSIPWAVYTELRREKFTVDRHKAKLLSTLLSKALLNHFMNIHICLKELHLSLCIKVCVASDFLLIYLLILFRGILPKQQSCLQESIFIKVAFTKLNKRLNLFFIEQSGERCPSQSE